MKFKIILITLLVSVTLNAQKQFVSTIKNVDLEFTEYSGHAAWQFNNNTIGDAWSYGTPGMLVYGANSELCSAIEADIRNIDSGPESNAGISISVNESNESTDNAYNGSENYSLTLSGNTVKLHAGTNHTLVDYIAPEVASNTVQGIDEKSWYNLKLKFQDNTILGYVNDSLYISYSADSIKKIGKFAIIGANGKNEYKNIIAKYHDYPHYTSSDTIVEYISDSNFAMYDQLPFTSLDHTETIVEDDGLDHIISHYITYNKSEVYGSTSAIEVPKIKIYPNPTSEYININTINNNTRLITHDMIGRTLGSYRLKLGVNRIDLTRYPVGVYMFRLIYDRRVILNKKIIVSE